MQVRMGPCALCAASSRKKAEPKEVQTFLDKEVYPQYVCGPHLFTLAEAKNGKPELPFAEPVRGNAVVAAK